MKIKFVPQIVFVSALLVLLGACATYYPSSEPADIFGTWKNSLGTVWTIKEDGTFDADIDHDGKRDAWGKYVISGDQVTFIRVGGIKPRHCGRNAVYHFKRLDFDTLHFTLVSDRCALRRKNVLLDWKRQ
jgi:hypothetical protein